MNIFSMTETLTNYLSRPKRPPESARRKGSVGSGGPYYYYSQEEFARWYPPKIELSDLKRGTFYFGCSATHVGYDPAYVPYEATWQNVDLPRVNREDDEMMHDAEFGLVSLDRLDEDIRGRVGEFFERIREADKAGRVHWKVGNYPALKDRLAKEAEATAPEVCDE
jgi:hypothetical protein